MPGDLTDRIAEVLREHYAVFDETGHINGTVPGNGAWDCWCGEVYNTTRGAVTGHVAKRVAEALQLTEETRIVRSICDMADPGIPERRWVSGWTAVEPKPAEETNAHE